MSKREHRRSIVTFRNHFVTVLFCPPCEHGWTESADHPSLSLIDIKRSEERRVDPPPFATRSDFAMPNTNC